MELSDKAFLGTGWRFPPTFSRMTGSVDLVSAEQDIRESLWVLFSTAPGERIMLPEYGCDIWQMVFRTINTTRARQIEEFIRQAVLYWEPRITVDSVTVTQEATPDGRVLINLAYTISNTNTRSNLVYPFYLQEGSIPAQLP